MPTGKHCSNFPSENSKLYPLHSTTDTLLCCRLFSSLNSSTSIILCSGSATQLFRVSPMWFARYKYCGIWAWGMGTRYPVHHSYCTILINLAITRHRASGYSWNTSLVPGHRGSGWCRKNIGQQGQNPFFFFELCGQLLISIWAKEQ